MKSESEIRQKLEKLRQEHEELLRKSTDSPTNPDGTANTPHLMAISNRGYLGALEWVLEEDSAQEALDSEVTN